MNDVCFITNEYVVSQHYLFFDEDVSKAAYLLSLISLDNTEKFITSSTNIVKKFVNTIIGCMHIYIEG